MSDCELIILRCNERDISYSHRIIQVLGTPVIIRYNNTKMTLIIL